MKKDGCPMDNRLFLRPDVQNASPVARGFSRFSWTTQFVRKMERKMS